MIINTSLETWNGHKTVVVSTLRSQEANIRSSLKNTIKQNHLFQKYYSEALIEQLTYVKKFT